MRERPGIIVYNKLRHYNLRMCFVLAAEARKRHNF